MSVGDKPGAKALEGWAPRRRAREDFLARPPADFRPSCAILQLTPGLELNVAYTALPIVTAGLDVLQLDLANYRIPTRSADEAAAMHYLFTSEEAMDAARLILRDGYFDNEVPIVITRGETYTVLEGNRRVAALKALADPTIVPHYQQQLRGLLKRYSTEAQDLPSAIRVLVAPDEVTAAPHIARLHTGQSKRPWTRDQQANFYYSLLDASTSVSDIRAMYPGAQVPRFIRMAVMRRFVTAAPFSDPSLRPYAASSALTMSSLEYAYRNPEILDAIGISFESDGLLAPAGMTPEKQAAALNAKQVDALEYLIDGFWRGKFNTRSPEFRKGSDELATLITEMTAARGPIPEGTTGSDGSSSNTNDSLGSDPVQGGQRSSSSSPSRGSTTTQNGEKESSGSGPTNERGPNSPDTKDKLEMGGVDYASHTTVNLQYRYLELRRISLQTLPTAAAMLLRSILETTIKFHFEATPTPVSGELANVFKKVATTYGSEKALQACISRIQSGDATRPGTIRWFNLVSHSADVVVADSDIRAAWALLNPVLRRLLRPA